MPSKWDPRLDGLIRVQAGWLAFGRRSFNVWWLLTDPPVTAGQLHDAAETVAAWHSLVGAGYMSENHQLYQVAAADRSFSPIAMYSRKAVGQYGIIRNEFNPMLPAPQAPVIELLTGVNRYRPHRTYMSGGTTLLLGQPLPFSTSDMTVLEEVAAAALELAWAQLVSGFNLVRGCVMVAMRKQGEIWDPDPITGVHVDRHYTGTRVRRASGRQRVGQVF